MYYFLSFIPVFINIILLPLSLKYGFQDIWLLGASIPNFRTAMNILFVPVYLLTVNIFFTVKNGKKIFRGILISMAVIDLNTLISYVDWGLSTGLLFNPDAETVMVLNYVDTVFPILIVLFGMLIFHIVRKLKARKK